MLASIVLALALATQPNTRLRFSDVPCHTVADCWLDAEGHPIARPKRYRGRALPHGDCGKHLTWLDHRLTCTAPPSADGGASQPMCTAEFIGDKC